MALSGPRVIKHAGVLGTGSTTRYERVPKTRLPNFLGERPRRHGGGAPRGARQAFWPSNEGFERPGTATGDADADCRCRRQREGKGGIVIPNSDSSLSQESGV